MPTDPVLLLSKPLRSTTKSCEIEDHLMTALNAGHAEGKMTRATTASRSTGARTGCPMDGPPSVFTRNHSLKTQDEPWATTFS